MRNSRRLNAIPMPRRGEIWLADLSLPHGTEPGKTRPVLIVQSQALLDAGHPSTYVVPLTTRLVEDAEPLRIRVRAAGRLPRDSDLLMDQLRAIDNRRLVSGPIHEVPSATMKHIMASLAELFGMRI
jgi:mRNA interferase MazF